MFFYFSLLTLLIVEGCIFSINNSERSKNCFLILSGLELSFVLGYRALSVGVDTANYYSMYLSYDIFQWKSILTLYNISYTELGYNLISLICSLLGVGATQFFFILAIITISGIFLYIKYFSCNIYLSVYLFVCLMYYFLCFNAMRQMAALGLLMIALIFWDKKQKKKFILFILAASLIHMSAISFLVVFVISYIKLYKTDYIKAILVIILCIILSDQVIQIVFTLFSNYSYLKYMETGAWKHQLFYLLIFFAILPFKNIYNCNLLNQKCSESMEDLLYKIFFFAVLIGCCTFQVSYLARAAYYFTLPAILVLVPKVLGKIKSSPKRLIGNLLIYGIMFTYYLFLIIRNSNGVVPYKFYWQ